jgi:prepilin-type N-terminal cleavage/methylation domain-containing protein
VKSGFTLVEVMVAVAIAALLIVGVSASTQASIRTAERQKAGSRADEVRSRTVELFREDWRGRIRIVRPSAPDPAGIRTLALSTTADSLLSQSSRSVRVVTYSASEKGLSRVEGESETPLCPGPVKLDFWNGVAWKDRPDGGILAVRLGFQDPEEFVVFR